MHINRMATENLLGIAIYKMQCRFLIDENNKYYYKLFIQVALKFTSGGACSDA